MSAFSLMSYKTSTLFHLQRASATVWITFCDKSQLITFSRLHCISCTIRLYVIWDSIQDASTFPVFYCHKRTSKHTQKVDTNLQLVEHWNLLESMNLWHFTFLILKCYPLLPSHRRRLFSAVVVIIITSGNAEMWKICFRTAAKKSSSRWVEEREKKDKWNVVR